MPGNMLGELRRQPAGLLVAAPLHLARALERLVGPAHDGAAVASGPRVDVGPRRLPDQAAILAPAVERIERRRGEGKGAGEPEGPARHEGRDVAAGREDRLPRPDPPSVRRLEQDALAVRLVAGDAGPVVGLEALAEAAARSAWVKRSGSISPAARESRAAGRSKENRSRMSLGESRSTSIPISRAGPALPLQGTTSRRCEARYRLDLRRKSASPPTSPASRSIPLTASRQSR